MLRIKQGNATTSRYVPLKQVSVKATIRSFAANVTINQIFHNDETTPIEAVYCFPIEEQAAIYSFIAHIDDRQIIAQLKEKKQAQQEYNDALQQGHGAYLLEQDEKSQDNFIINVGALPPGKECHIEISYVTELDLVQNGTMIRFVVPTTIAPRYHPKKSSIASSTCSTPTYIQSVPYSVEFHCQIGKVDVAGVRSSSHPIQVGLNKEDVYVIQFAKQNTHLDRDIILDIQLAQNRSNTIVAVAHNAIMASFTPNQQDCQRAIDTTEETNEFIFIVDCSGSMTGENKIGYARQAMLLFLKSLPLNSYFNIIRFGSTYETLFKDTTAIYNKENAQQAEELTNNMQANLGGTELLSSLQWLEEHQPKQGRARQIFLVTDGEISNVDEVLDLCRSMSSSARIFSFGLGRSPSRSLVKGLARATNGRYIFIPPETSVDVYVGEQLEKALQSCITNVQVKWNLGRSVMNVPTKTPPVYANDRLIVYALSTDDDRSCIFNHDSNVKLFNDKYQLGDAKVNRISNVSDDGTITRLAAKALILELQHSKLPSVKKKSGSLQPRFAKDVQETIERSLSLKYNILSPHTAFIGIEKRVNGKNVDMILREVPIQISADDQHQPDIYAPLMMTSSILYARQQPSTYMHDSRRQSCEMSFTGNDCTRTCRTSAMTINAANMSRHQVQMNTPCSIRSASYSNAPVKSSMPNFMKRTRGFPKRSETTKSRLQTCAISDDVYRSGSDNMTKAEDRIRKQKKEKEILPTGDQNIVRYLIKKQSFDGLWELDSENIEKLTGTPLSRFQQSTNIQVLVTAIVLLLLETRFGSFSSMWHGVVQKACERLLHLLGNDSKKAEKLFEDIRKQL